MIKSIRTVALGGAAVLAMLLTGCAVDGPGVGPVYSSGVGYTGYGLYDGPYYGGYGPYYGDTVVIGGGYRHRGYYGNHHFYGGGYRGGRSGGRFGGSRGFAGPRQTSVRTGGGNFSGGHVGGGNHGGGHR